MKNKHLVRSLCKSLLFVILYQPSLFSDSVGELLSKITVNETIKNTFKSNYALFNSTYSKSNIVLTNVALKNFQIIRQIENQSDFFSGILEKAEFYDLFALHYFKIHLQPNSADRLIQNNKAYTFWEKIVNLELSNVNLLPSNAFSNYQSQIPKEILARAFEMDRYWHQSAPLLKSTLINSNWETRYQIFNQFYLDGLTIQTSLLNNLLIYNLEKENIETAKKIIETVKLPFDHYNRDWLRMLEIEKSLKPNVISNRNNSTLEKNQFFNSYTLYSDFIEQLSKKERRNADTPFSIFNKANELLFYNSKSSSFHFIDTTDRSRLNKTLDAYSKALSSNPNSHEFNYNLGLIYAKINRYPNALFFLEEAIKAKTTPEALYAAALLCIKLKDYEKGYNYLIETLIYKKNDSILYNNIGICALNHPSKKINKLAEFYINKAIELEDGNYNFYLTKAEYELRNKNYIAYTNLQIKAIEKLEKADSIGLQQYIPYFPESKGVTNELPRLIQKEIGVIKERIQLKNE